MLQCKLVKTVNVIGEVQVNVIMSLDNAFVLMVLKETSVTDVKLIIGDLTMVFQDV